VNIANRWHQLAVNKYIYYSLHRYPSNFVLGYCIAEVIGVQITALKLKQPNLG